MHIGITIFCIMITIGIYLASIRFHQKWPSPFTLPIFVSTLAIIGILLMSGLTYEDYTFAKDIMSFLLGPATVALAIPLYRQRKIFFKHLLPVCIGIIGGTIITIVVAFYAALLLGLQTQIVTSFTLKSITIPIASELAPIIGADPSLVMLFVMITGIGGAMFGSLILNVANVSHPIARGLSFGTISHGIGTSEAMKEGDLTGASSSVAMGLAGIITSLIVPLILPLLFFMNS